MRRWSKWIIAAVVVAAVVGWQWRSATQPMTVETGLVREAPLVAEWSAVGYVEALSADVTSQQVARVDRVAVREGDAVRPGQVLAELDSRAVRAQVLGAGAAVDAASARGASARALLSEYAAGQVERERRAASEVIACRERLGQATAALDAERKSAPARVAAAEADLEAARAALKDSERGGRPEELAQAEAEATAAEASLARAKSDRDRAKALLDQGAFAQRDLDAAQESVALAQAALDVRRKAIALLRQGAREDVVGAARARLRAAEAQVTVAESLRANVSAQEHRVAEARAAMRSAEAALAEARAGRSRLEAMRQDVTAARAGTAQSRAALDQSRTTRDDGIVRAPFAGVVSRRFVDPGDMAAPTTPLFSIVDSGRTWVSAEVDEQDLAPVRVGQEVVVSASAYAGREIRGRVARIGGAAVPQTDIRTGARIVRVRVTIDSPEERSLLKPGMEVHVSGSATLSPRAVLAPSDSVMDDDAGSAVWVVTDGVVRRRAVRTGRIVGRDTEIREGLKAGDRVAVSGKEKLTDGMRVQPSPSPEKR